MALKVGDYVRATDNNTNPYFGVVESVEKDKVWVLTDHEASDPMWRKWNREWSKPHQWTLCDRPKSHIENMAEYYHAITGEI